MNLISNEFYKSTAKRVIFRFVRGFIAGSVSAMALVTLSDAGSWVELGNALANLLFALISGGLTGGLMAMDKWFRDLGVSKKK